MPADAVQNLSVCAREPIHLPGSIQPHGLLLVVDPKTDRIDQAAGDSASLLNFSEAVLGKTLYRVLGVSLASLLERAETTLGREPTYLGNAASLVFPDGLAITALLVEGQVVVEVEPSSAQPISAAKALANIRTITERIGGASSLIEACNVAAKDIRRITGYDRVMIYQFHPDGTGSVIAEEKDDDLASLLNHRFPASDIPAQARELYRRNAIRVIPDVGYTPALLEPALSPTTGQPLDMSHCVLRSVSPVHIKYLQNMGVGASMSVSLLPAGELWGLIACHNTARRSVPYESQEACRHVGQILSLQVQAREESDSHRIGRELGAARDGVMRALISADDPGDVLLGLCPDLQNIAPSHGMAVCRSGTVRMAGLTPTGAQISQLAAWLEQRLTDNGILATDCLAELYPQAYTFVSEASGLLATILPGDDPVTLMWFRAEQVVEVNWAGNPHEPVDLGYRLGTINPRKSFATWRETVRGRARPWDAVEIESVEGFSPRAAFVLQQKRVRELNDLLGQANERLAALAATDGLTGIGNKRSFDERQQKGWKRASRPPRRSLAMIILGLDFFQTIIRCRHGRRRVLPPPDRDGYQGCDG